MEQEIREFIEYLHNTKKTSQNTEVSYQRDLNKMAAYLEDRGITAVTEVREFDLMGCRLEGPFIAYKTTSDIISDGIAFGSVQVPSHGKPIILLADRQTTGGYAKIATVISVDIPKLVQRKTEQKVRFQAVSVEEAQKLLADEMKELNDFRSQIYTPCKEVLDCRLVAKRISALFE